MLLDINCDMGEGIGSDEKLMPFITSANIACGYHAGDADTMRRTTELACQYGVKVGAHPSFPDKQNFGRKEMQLSLDEIYELVIQQLILLNDLASDFGTQLHHVKPHGALYNMSARDPELAAVIALAVKDFNKDLVLYGLSGSNSIDAAASIGLETANEVFADRNYEDDGSLTPRSMPHAMITDLHEVEQHILRIITDGEVRTSSGSIIPLKADTVCIHGDGIHALEFAKLVSNLLKDKK